MAKKKVSLDNIMSLAEEYSNNQNNNVQSSSKRNSNKVSMDNILSLSQKYSTGELPLNSKVRQTSSNVTNNILLPPAQTDANTFGTFSNGYQPKGISGHGTLSKTGQKTKVDTGRYEYNDKLKTNTKVLKEQNIWQAEDGTQWIWNGKTNEYKQYNGSNKKDSKDGVNFVESNEDNVFERADEAVKQDQQRKKMSGIEEVVTPVDALKSGYYIGKNVISGVKGALLSSINYISDANNNLGGAIAGKVTAKILGVDENSETFQFTTNVLNNEMKNNFIQSPTNRVIDELNRNINSQEKIDARNQKIQENIEKAETYGGKIGKYLSEQAPSIGNNLFNMAISVINPAIGTASFMTSAGGNYLQEAKSQGMNENQSILYATIMGGVEGGTESIISGSMLENGAKLFGVGNVAKQSLNNVVNSFGFNIAENFVQEAVTEPINELVKEKVAGEEFADWDNIVQRSFKAGLDGAISSIILSGASVGINSSKNAINKLKKGENLSHEETKNIIKDAEKKGIAVNDLLEEAIKENIESVKNVSLENNQAQLQGLQQELTKTQEEYKSTEDRIDGVNKNKDANVLTSAYGRDNYDRQKREINGSWDGWMEENKNHNRIIYDIDEGIIKKRINGQWLELPNPNNTSNVDTVDKVSTSNNIIPQNDKNMQKNQKEKINSQVIEKKNERIAEQVGEKNKLSSKAQKYLVRQENKLKKNILENLETTRFGNNKIVLNEAIAELENEYNREGKISQNTINKVFDNLYSDLKKLDVDYYNMYKDLKKEIRNTKLYAPENIVKDIDYNNFNVLKLTSDKNNLSVDSYYKELSDSYPELFPSTIINSSEQLQRISDVVKDIVKVETNVEAYNNKYLGKDYKEWAKKDFENLVEEFKKQLKIIKTYNEEKQYKDTDVVTIDGLKNISSKEIKGLYEQRKEFQKEYNKVNNKLLLTNREKLIVDKLLKHEMTIEDILPRSK